MGMFTNSHMFDNMGMLNRGRTCLVIFIEAEGVMSQQG